ncbi:hypothetical protein EDS67_17745 [candidate division KSB1 bacterium]|nr:MAG: hypothetical protein EDS67_17745 [candidate division KSB1 bacterium]MCE7944063.1 hypothetical protein [Chlorobi bacterium CHB1]
MLKNYNDGSVTNSKLYLHGQNDYPLLEKDKTSAAAENLAVYVYGLNGAIAKRAGSTVLFLLKDHLGSTRVAMDATGLVHTYYDYDALGNLIRTGTTNEVTYQFTGQEFDESGLHNYRARMYDSDLGRFYAVDPAEEFTSPFIYAGNNALRYTDPSGNFIWAPVIAGAMLGGFLGAVQADSYNIPWYQGLVKGAFVGAVGGALSNFGGGTFLNNLTWGAAEGAFTGGLNAALYKKDIERGMLRGAAWGSAFATITSGIEATRNKIEGYGFKTNEGVIKDLRNETINSSAATRSANANRTIDFVQKRYGMENVDMVYDPSIQDYGVTNLNTGNVRIGPPAFNSTSELKATIAHEYAHSVLDRVMIGGRWQWVSPMEAWNYNDGIIGYGAEIVNSGRLRISHSTLAGTFPNTTNHLNPYWHRFGWKKWWHLIPRRF